MSVMKILMDVLRHVQILCLVMSAPVDQAINWQVTDGDAMVSDLIRQLVRTQTYLPWVLNY